ncbi:TPA: ead/Ea22-like family protein [Enterobacter hormaechei]|uniref:ead/Ea22-like family protein n=1 Tax=Enterobacter hormaechei TaxID=158836 RepID=UPI000F88233F|nr:ead/Ea22-like family protein [Enterobacter hormaechei]MCE1444246.1 ead/Ea22-like family protein [Enterobacter hormaechei]MCE1452616.1 ead/Ea22-like family protein [Enterobacter hormaechei]RTO92200.1 ead/Ea22-like family protein [Enterobacter hormaechei]HEM8101552.1 ead/Ea22-like family protein [Enterobacter hormaechei]HEM8123724.1 ead/Ea22-like family protein [Enterobacter hormaechei]
MSNIDKRALREAAEKATALNLDTAQEARQEDDECIECPTCGGDGYMEVQRDYCNIDGVALGVLFYGIGEHHGLAEAFFRAANPATVLALLDEMEVKDTRISEQAGTIANQEKWIRGIEEAMITATDRAKAAEKRIAEMSESNRLLCADSMIKQDRIAKLEAREVTLPENITSANAPEVIEIAAEAERLGLRGTYASYAVGWNARGKADKEALREAGVKVAAAGKGE